MNSKGLLLILVIANFCWAIEGTKTIEPALVFEYKFDEPIVDVIFDSATMTVKEARALGVKGLEEKKATERVKMPYPRVVITEKEVKFLNESGKVERQVVLREDDYEIEDSDIFLPTGKVIILGSNEAYSRYLDLVDEKGNRRRLAKSGEFFNAKISGNGRYIVTGNSILQSGENCTLYDIEGKKLWEYTIPGTPMSDWIMHILYDGKVVVVANLLGEEKENIGRVTLIDIDGKKLWEYKIERGDYDILSTMDGKIIIYGSKSSIEKYILYGFNKDGNLLWQPKEQIGFRNSFFQLAISKDGKYLLGTIGWEYLWKMDIKTGDFLWKCLLNGEKPDITGTSEDGRYILLSDRLKPHYSILLNGKDGRVLKQTEGRGEFLGKDKIWRKKGNKLEIFNISDILRK